MTPKLSVVTTVYNGEPYADRAVPSILAQTFEDFEYIIADDGSTDVGGGFSRPEGKAWRRRPMFMPPASFTGRLNGRPAA